MMSRRWDGMCRYRMICGGVRDISLVRNRSLGKIIKSREQNSGVFLTPRRTPTSSHALWHIHQSETTYLLVTVECYQIRDILFESSGGKEPLICCLSPISYNPERRKSGRIELRQDTQGNELLSRMHSLLNKGQRIIAFVKGK